MEDTQQVPQTPTPVQQNPSTNVSPNPSQTVPATANIQQPQATSDEYASFGIRFVAAIIDSFIVGIVSSVLGFIAGFVDAVIGSDYSLVSSLMSVLMVLFSLFYYIYFIGSRGQTLGKMALGIRVVREDDKASPGYLKAFLRETVGKFISSMILLLGYLWVIWDDKKQGWHDKIAGTVVLKVKKDA